jgi:effector-binding domain-containing protein
MGPAIHELMTAVAAQGIASGGPVFARYLNMGSGLFDLEVGMPVSTTVAPTGRVMPGHLPAAKVARTTYQGPYDGLHAAWCEFGDWIKAQGLAPVQGLWECYVFGPESSPDPTTWRTDLYQPLLA